MGTRTGIVLIATVVALGGSVAAQQTPAPQAPPAPPGASSQTQRKPGTVQPKSGAARAQSRASKPADPGTSPPASRPPLHDRPIVIGQKVTLYDPVHAGHDISVYKDRRAYETDVNGIDATRVVGENRFDDNEDSALDVSNKVVAISARTTAKLLARKYRLSYVQITAGPHKGLKGYVPKEWLHAFGR